ncbi:putative RNA-binding Zn ribbon-like protein [Kineococcus xinjiangensis]|uniref:Putative RNA-binding Zn ribbon-like protein n=1 Tax=Kineococcus xinjiangensis TaxID=512762 RepID=A0A2S6IG39_9ACTN|nr:CGNR zinc finger domain-containing protein [Kineococcus xinjiangensis]PPK93171.1 putative RNA-binding Zn ribbon-like protein [Kineococcus xinjiangensis]
MVQPRSDLLADSSAADVVLRFANTHADGAGREERFADAAGVARWLTQNGRDDAAAHVTAADAAAVRELRDALVTVLLGHSQDPGTPEEALQRAEQFLRRTAHRHPLVAEVDRSGVRLSPAGDGVPGVLAEVLAAVAALALAGDWPRLKACRNEPCHFAFYDRSRNTSGAYCSTACRTRCAMRSYRGRQRDTAPADVPEA